MNAKIKIVFSNGFNLPIAKRTRTVEFELPFLFNDQYKDIARIEVEGVEADPSLINRPSFNYMLTMSNRGRLEIS